MTKAKRAPEKSHDIGHAIRNERVDAFVVGGGQAEQVVVLQGAEYPYRVLVESINDGAATLDANGTVLYANKRFAEILNVSPERFVGTPLQNHFSTAGREKLEQLIRK